MKVGFEEKIIFWYFFHELRIKRKFWVPMMDQNSDAPLLSFKKLYVAAFMNDLASQLIL